MEKKLKRHLWIPFVMLLLVPVPVVLLSHGTATGSGVNGELFSGISSLDSILAEAGGKPVLLNFWATWCGPCVRELPELEVVSHELAEEAVFLAIDIGDPDIRTLEAFRENNPVGITVVWLDPAEADLLALRYSLPDVLPVTLVLDGNGEEAARAVGARSGEWFTAAIAGASSGEDFQVMDHGEIHVYVVGPGEDPLVSELIEAAVEIAGEGGYDLLDPAIPADSAAMEQLYLPMSGWPYAQLCVNGACRPPVSSAGELSQAYRDMQ